MAIYSIRIKNLLSFDDAFISEIKDINCIVGKNNVGKSNLLKIIKYFYAKLNNERSLPPELHSNYNSYGSITIRYNTTRIKKIVTGKNNNSPFLKHIYNILFKDERSHSPFFRKPFKEDESFFDITLRVYRDESIRWSIEDKAVRDLLPILYPFFDIETRHIDLYDWNRVWNLISQLSSFNLKKITNEDVVDYLDEKISNSKGAYKDYISKVEGIIDTRNYSYKDKVLSYIKVGLKGQEFLNFGEDLNIQSDGTNSHKFIEIILKLLIVLTRREYITPMVYIDEPEIGLHPKLNENLISTLHEIYSGFEKSKEGIEKGKYKTPYPKVIFSTHSPNILKHTVRLFKDKQQVIHFSKPDNSGTKINKLNSHYKDSRFLNLFSDNEARLFFSNYILFVEGATELEVFRNYKLGQMFKFLNDIDVYEADDVTLKYLNPKFSKAAIPFQIIFDSDVAIAFDYTAKKLTLINAKIKMSNYKRKNKFCFYNKGGFGKRQLIQSVMNYDNRVLDFNSNGISFASFSIQRYVKAMNEILNDDSITLTHTTIEGVLINENSFHLFERWICDYFLNRMKYNGENSKPSRLFLSYKKDISSGRKSNSEVVKKVLSIDYLNVDLSTSDLVFIKEITVNHLRQCKKEIRGIAKSKNDMLNIYRLIFEGKTDTLLSRLHDDYADAVHSGVIDIVKRLRTDYLSALNPVMGKTGGWVTDFLNFSIDEINSYSADPNDFYKQFAFYFPELYGIIRKVSSAIA
ncbi:retron Eco8 family effector endonuclease [Escherichia coli]|nr:AAA family ATPase [Escherichia coli]VTM22088.1 Predicted ATPase [Raoultella terrigena]EFH7626003.1 AAA family ATPase [Escherichia coli]EGJ2805415.1 AAA family ATPase [Escherichia coli]EGQ6877029.1 AAA family ATPase [Escherichia coli]